jgi:uncharacterized membrane protein YphA (DoxX/SURF4 family)
MERVETKAIIQPEDTEADAPDTWDASAPASFLDRIQSSQVLIYLTLVSRLVLGGIFLLAGLSKLGDFNGLATSIDEYRMGIPIPVQDFMATVLPPLEIAVGIFLILGLFTRISAIVGGILMAMFLIAITQATVRGLSINCGCVATGPNANPISEAILNVLGPIGKTLTNEKADWQTVIRDAVFLLMAVHLALVPTVFGLDSLRRRSQEPLVEDQEGYLEEEEITQSPEATDP